MGTQRRSRQDTARGAAAAVRRAFVVSPGREGERLDVAVREALGDATPRPLSNADVRRVIVGGGVRVDGRVARGAGRPLREGERVSVDVDLRRLASQRERPPVPAAPRILFDDEHVVAVDKPAGLPTVPTPDSRRASLVEQVQNWLLAQRRDGAVVAAGRAPTARRDDQRRRDLLEDARLRQPVSTRRSPAAASRSATWPCARWLQRRVPGRVEGALDVSGRGKRGRVAAASTGGVPAATDSWSASASCDAALVEARPATGRKHQVRAHLAEAGLPLLGDTRYGGPSTFRGRRIPRPMLHAVRLRLPHPVSGAPVEIDAPLPEDFETLLTWLRKGAARRPRSTSDTDS